MCSVSYKVLDRHADEGSISLAPLDYKERENGYFYDRIRLHEGVTPNDLLRYLIGQVEIHAFREQIPSINEIFIRRVRETMPESLVEENV